MSYKRLYLYSGSGATVLLLFALLFSWGLQIEGVEYISCPGTEDSPCVTYFNVSNPTARSIYIYNYDDLALEFEPGVKDYQLYVMYYGKWRYTNFTMETRLGNIPEDRKYVFVFPRYSTKEFKLVGIKYDPTQSVDYTIGGSSGRWFSMYENVCEEEVISKTIQTGVILDNITITTSCDMNLSNCTTGSYVTSYINSTPIYDTISETVCTRTKGINITYPTGRNEYVSFDDKLCSIEETTLTCKKKGRGASEYDMFADECRAGEVCEQIDLNTWETTTKYEEVGGRLNVME